MTDARILWRVAGVVGALALLGCGDGSGIGEAGGDDEPKAPYTLALVNTTADITGPVHFVVQQGDSFVEGVLDEESAAGCDGPDVAGMWEPEVEVHAWTDSGLTWELALELEEGECVEEAVDFTTTTTTIQAFAIGEESFLPVRVHFGGEYVGLVGKAMSRERAEEFGELWKQVRHPDDFNLSRKWLVEQIREGLVVWLAPELEREYRLHLFYGDGRSFYSPTIFYYEPGVERVAFTWKEKGPFE